MSDFTTASKTAFQHEGVRFIAINVAEIDAGKHAALPLVGDARAVLDELLPLVAGYRVGAGYAERVAASQSDWRAEVDRVCNPQSDPSDPQPNPQSAIRNPQSLEQAHVIGVLQDTLAPTDVIVIRQLRRPWPIRSLHHARHPRAR